LAANKKVRNKHSRGGRATNGGGGVLVAPSDGAVRCEREHAKVRHCSV